jgi:hypothetical protein
MQPPESNDRPVYEAILNYTKEALDFLKQKFPSGPTEEMISTARSMSESSRFPLTAWQLLLLDTAAERSKLKSYENCLIVLRANTTIAPQLGTSVGTALIQSARQEQQVIDQVLTRLLIEQKRYEITQAEVDDGYGNFAQDLFCKIVIVDVVAPLAAVSVHQPVKLEDHLVLRRLTKADSDALRALGMDNDLLPPTSGIAARYELPFTIGSPNPTEREKALSARETVNQSIERVVWLLNLMYSSDAGCRGTCETMIPPMGNIFQYWGGSRKIVYPHNHLGEDRAKEIKVLWDDCRDGNVWKRSALHTAIRRFSYGLERLRDDDTIVDLVIAAEAILLENVDDPKYRGEIKYRFCFNGALCAKDIGIDPVTAYKHLSMSYDMRSQFVHGGESQKDDKALKPIIAELTKLIRSIILEGIHRAKSKPKQLFPWKTMLDSLLQPPSEITPQSRPEETG